MKAIETQATNLATSTPTAYLREDVVKVIMAHYINKRGAGRFNASHLCGLVRVTLRSQLGIGDAPLPSELNDMVKAEVAGLESNLVTRMASKGHGFSGESKAKAVFSASSVLLRRTANFDKPLTFKEQITEIQRKRGNLVEKRNKLSTIATDGSRHYADNVQEQVLSITKGIAKLDALHAFVLKEEQETGKAVV